MNANSVIWNYIQIFGGLRTIKKMIHQGTHRSGMDLALFLSIGKPCSNKNLRGRKETGLYSYSSAIP